MTMGLEPYSTLFRESTRFHMQNKATCRCYPLTHMHTHVLIHAYNPLPKI